jgi:hypothetical protein
MSGGYALEAAGLGNGSGYASPLRDLRGLGTHKSTSDFGSMYYSNGMGQYIRKHISPKLAKL